MVCATKLQILQEAATSGLRVSDVARRHDVVPQQIYIWRRQLLAKVKAETNGRDAPPRFVPVSVIGETEATEAPHGERPGSGDKPRSAASGRPGISEKIAARGITPDFYVPRLDQLAGFMDELKGNNVKLVIIDTPPHSDERSLAAIRPADLVLVPFRPSLLDLRALEDMARLVGVAEKTAQTVLLMNARPSRSPLVQEALEAAGTFGLAVCPVTISDRTAFNHAIIAAQGVTEYEPTSKAAVEIVALRQFIAKQLKIKKATP